jgi:uncharacterized membrane protein (Fun14 family)
MKPIDWSRLEKDMDHVTPKCIRDMTKISQAVLGWYFLSLINLALSVVIGLDNHLPHSNVELSERLWIIGEFCIHGFT